jgi:endonuclease/exonuclease/phosphatase family metal-dependent hydrolase
MVLAYFNHMFGCDGHRLWPFAKMHVHHFLGNFEKPNRKNFLEMFMHGAYKVIGGHSVIKKMAHVEATVGLILRQNPDVVAIGEVFGTRQSEELQRELSKIGYKSFLFGNGSSASDGIDTVGTLLASKKKIKPIFESKWEKLHPKFGGGGGMVYGTIGKLHVISLHLAMVRFSRHFFTQMAVLKKLIAKAKDAPLIVLGDFNMSYEVIKKRFPILAKMKHMTPFISTFRHYPGRDIDHILGMHVRQKGKAKLIKGSSDHHMVQAEIDMPK